ncbi:MAG: type III-B CRISPR-associated protein Cas10/Cmr2 [Anaerolineae bacterium]|nr:type III-B CRISPR-associated protein Cas10/Cmr2 [Anaerolineae bacterium]
MSDSILIFTFSPIQPFIAEARRAGDLYAGSKILVELARAVGKTIQEQNGKLIYPASLDTDVPNKLVARVNWEQVASIANAAQDGLHQEWQKIADSTRNRVMCNWELETDAEWEAIWRRQTGNLWEIYWAAAQIGPKGYADAYEEASRGLDARKRCHDFDPDEEAGIKDGLSGKRAALHTHRQDAKDYWKIASVRICRKEASRLRPEGRERLDAIGAIKRFGGLDQSIDSTSSVAAWDFLNAALRFEEELGIYKQAVEALLGEHKYLVGSNPAWPYDGDLLFMETLATARLEDSYGLTNPDEQSLKAALEALQDLYRVMPTRPRPYYALLQFDGDNMGQQINRCLQASDPEAAHRAFSEKLALFTQAAQESLDAKLKVYIGGDDVVALLPLSLALPQARQLAATFKEITGGTASAGITIAHHLYPLSATLQAARAAEHAAKTMEGKASVCVRCLRRSGEDIQVRSEWNTMGDTFERLVELFQSGSLSDRLAYSVLESAYAFPEANSMFEAEVYRLLSRHSSREFNCEKEWAATLRTWAATLPNQTEELGHWLVLARFMAMGGAE